MAKPQRTQGASTKGRADAPSAPASASDAARAEIALRAFEIWQEAGCPEGRHEDHWYQAERELGAPSSRPA